MKRLIAIFGVLILVCGFAGFSYAYPVEFTDTTEFYAFGTVESEDLNGYSGAFVNWLEFTYDWVSWTHQFELNPVPESIISAQLTLYLAEYDTDTCNPYTWEFAKALTEDGWWYLGEVDTGPYVGGVEVESVEDGTFSVFLMSTWGNFFIQKSELLISYEAVPEPATILLLGLGLLGLGLGIRKR